MGRIELVERYLTDDLYAQKTLTIARPAISHRTGIIQGIYELMIEPDDPRLFYYGAKVADTSRIFSQSTHNENGGAGLTRSVGMAAAIGECFERYCLSFFEASSFVFSSYSSLKTRGYEVVDPSDFALFSENQYSQSGFKFKKFTENSKINWVCGYSLIQQKPILIPACFVYIPYADLDEENITYAISTGAACGRSKEEAILKGIYEVIERDALMIVWLNKLICPLMDLSSGKWINQVFHERFLPSGLKFYVANITLDIAIPTMFSLIIDDVNDGLAVSAGAATNLDGEKAALKALVESAQTRLWLKSVRSDVKRTFRDDFSDVKSFKDHILLYSNSNSIQFTEFITTSQKLYKFDKVGKQQHNSSVQYALQTCLQLLSAKGMDVIVVDLTTNDILSLGFYVVKVLVPGMQELNSEHNYRFLAGKRLYKVPRIIGYTQKQLSEEELNQIPHPFP